MEAIIEALGFDPWTFLLQAINIIIILSALYFLLWKPVVKALTNREEKIEENLKEAAAAREKAEEALTSYQQQIDQAHQEAQAILEQATKLSETTRQEILAQAKQEADRILEQARRDIEKEKKAAMDNIRSQAADLILMATTKILARNLSAGDQEHLIREALAEVERLQ